MTATPTPWPLVKIEVTAAWDFEGTSPETVRTALLGQLRRGNVSLTDVFNGEPTTTLTLEALKTVFRNLGYSGKPDVISAIFTKLIDKEDPKASITFEALNGWLVHGALATTATTVKSTPAERAAQLSLAQKLQSSFDAGDEAWDASRLQKELNKALAAEGLRAVDLVHSWDTGNNQHKKLHPHKTLRGSSERSIDKKEYLTAIKKVCGGKCDAWYVMGREAAMEAFSQMDRTNDGEISTWELCRWLDPHGRLIAGGREKKQVKPSVYAIDSNKRPPLQPVAVSTLIEQAAAANSPQHRLAYSPTKLSTRLAMVRSFDPDAMESASKPRFMADKETKAKPRYASETSSLNSSRASSTTARQRHALSVDDLARGLDARANPVSLGRRSKTSSSTTTPMLTPASSSQASSTTASQPSSKEASVHPSPRLTPRDAAARADAAVAAIKPWSLITNRDEKVFAKGSVVDEAATGLCAAVAEATATPGRSKHSFSSVTPLYMQTPNSPSCPSLAMPKTARTRTELLARPKSAPFRTNPRGSQSARGKGVTFSMTPIVTELPPPPPPPAPFQGAPLNGGVAVL